MAWTLAVAFTETTAGASRHSRSSTQRRACGLRERRAAGVRGERRMVGSLGAKAHRRPAARGAAARSDRRADGRKESKTRARKDRAAGQWVNRNPAARPAIAKAYFTAA